MVRRGQESACRFHFTADGQVLLVGGGVGAGSWEPTGPDRFRYEILEPLFDRSGGWVGWVHIRQGAVQTGGGFTSTGSSVVYGTDGSRRYQVAVDIRAGRADPHDAPASAAGG